MIYPIAAPFQGCKVPLVPNEDGEHVNVTYLNSVRCHIHLMEHSYQWRLLVELPESAIGHRKRSEVSARMNLVGRKLLEGNDDKHGDVWMHVGVDYDGEVCYSFTFDQFPTKDQVDERICQALSFFEAWGYILTHASLLPSDSSVRLNSNYQDRQEVILNRWDEALGHLDKSLQAANGESLQAANGEANNCHDRTLKFFEDYSFANDHVVVIPDSLLCPASNVDINEADHSADGISDVDESGPTYFDAAGNKAPFWCCWSTVDYLESIIRSDNSCSTETDDTIE